jgi:hypothetical protein
MGFNSAFKGLTLILLTWTIWRSPINASKWRMGFNSEFKVLTLILLTWTIWRAATNVSKWRMGFNSAFKVLMLYKAEDAVCSDIRTIHSTQSERNVEFLNIKSCST